MTQDERSRIKKYFKKFPTWAVVVIAILGLPSLLVGLSSPSSSFGGFSLFWGVLWTALGVWRIVSYYNKPSDAEMDAWIKEDMETLPSRALAKADLDPSEVIAKPVTVYGPRFWNIGGAEVGIKKGADGIVRFIPIEVTVIHFTAHQLVSYQCVLDLTTGNPLSERTDEYFYRDVVSVSTQSESLTLEGIDSKLSKGPLAALMVGGKLQLNAAEIFKLTTSGATRTDPRKPSLAHYIAAVNGDRLAGDVARFVTAEPQNGIGDLFRSAEALHGHKGLEHLVQLWPLAFGDHLV